MKRSFIYFSMLVVASMIGLGSCDRPDIDDVEKPYDEVPLDSVAVIDTTDSGIPVYSFPKVDSVPLEVGNLLAEGSDVGVTIEIVKVENQNFIFELRPGAQIQSFRFDVFPLSQLYNSLLNDGMVGKDAVDINEKIRNYVFAEDGSGGFQISVKDFASPEDFLQIEYDWMNTTYAAATAIAIPDCDYVIAVVACTDTDCSSASQEELTLCFVHTTSEALIGDPQVDIDVNVGYTKFAVSHIPNADAAGVYFFGWLTEEIDAYIDVFGNRLFRDFIRTRVSSPSSASDPAALVYSVDYGSEGNPDVQSTTCAVAVDANLTPAANFSRKDFHLLEVPEDQELVVPAVKIVPERVAAAYFEFDVEMPKDCNTIFYRVYTADQKAALENATSVQQKLEAIDLVNNGYGCHNPNFKWDKDAETGSEAIGTSGKVRLEYLGGLEPGGTYCIGYTGRNGYGSAGQLTFTELFTLDQRNLTSPDECKVKDLKLWLSDQTRTSFKQNITYDPSTVSMVYVQYMTKDANPGLWTDSSWKEWVDYIFTPSESGTGSVEYANLNVNAWPTVPSGSDPFTWTGMNPDTEYTVYLCAEDFDGNISPMQFASIKTSEVQVGPDPTVNMSLVSASDDQFDWTVWYRIDHDVEYFLYCYTTSASDLAPYIPGVNQGHINNIAESGISYEKWRDGIYEWVAAGFTGEGGGMDTNSDTYQTWSGDQVVIAACIAVGKDETGAPVYNFFHLICENGKARTLEDIFNVSK